MTRISKNAVEDSEDYKFAYKQLSRFLAGLQDKNAHFFIDELLSESEQVMLVKRFTAIYLFQEGHNPYRVSQMIGVSESTAQRLHHGYREGIYNNLLKCIKKSEKAEFLTVLQDFLLSKADAKARTRLLKKAL